MVKGVPFDVRFPENTVTRAEAMRAFEDLWAQASDLPEMTFRRNQCRNIGGKSRKKKEVTME